MNEPEFEYLKVEITRTESTELYLKVPKGWRPTGRDHALIAKAADETIDRSEWDSFGWQDTVEAQCHNVCSAEEAETYQVFDVVAHLLEADLDAALRTALDPQFNPSPITLTAEERAVVLAEAKILMQTCQDPKQAVLMAVFAFCNKATRLLPTEHPPETTAPSPPQSHPPADSGAPLPGL